MPRRSGTPSLSLASRQQTAYYDARWGVSSGINSQRPELSRRFSVAVGDWHYKGIGLFDRTHLRYFGRRSAIAMMTGTGLRLEAVDRTFGPNPIGSLATPHEPWSIRPVGYHAKSRFGSKDNFQKYLTPVSVASGSTIAES